MRRAALYARVSTRRQEKEATIESQVAHIVSYAQQQEYELPAERHYLDQAVSGKLLARPGLDRLRDAALVHEFEVVLCLSPDRLARQLGAQQVVLDELKRVGVEVIFVSQPTLADSPQAQLLLNIQGAFAEYERLMISERMRRGKLYRLRHGQSCPIQAPYGYRYQSAQAGQGSRWVVVEAEALIVKQMFGWYTQEPMTVSDIAQRLNGQGVPAPQGTVWHRSTVNCLLRQSAYRGLVYHNHHQSDETSVGQPRRQGQGRMKLPRRVPRPVEEWIEIQVPPLVEESLWQATQERLDMNRRLAPRNCQHPYLLRGLLVCGQCGHTLQGRTQQERRYYVCRSAPGLAKHTCSIRADAVEPLIRQALETLLQEPHRIRTAWQALQPGLALPAQLRPRQQRQATLQKQRQRLLDAYQAGILSLEELIDRQNPVEVELRELEKQLSAVQPALTDLSLEIFTQRIERALATAEVETQQEVLRLLIERIVVTDEALTVEHIVPTVNNYSRLYPTNHQ
jgi:site-specific DNA recombinase